MHSFCPRLLCLSCLLLISWGAFAQQTILHCGSLIDGKNDKARSKMSIVIEGKTIVAIEKGYKKGAEGDQIIDLTEQTVMPGLIDMHVHIEGQSSPSTYMDRFRLNPPDVAFRSLTYAKATLMAGFTTVRDLGGSGVNISLRNAINQGLVTGPRIYTVGKAIGTTGGHADPTNGMSQDLMGDPGPRDGVINGPDEAAKAVRQRYKDGADLIKITATGGVLSPAKDGQGPQFTQEEVDAIVEIANDYGMITAAHAHGAEGMKRAVLAGITTIEHGTLMTEEIMELMKEKGTYFVPTITAGIEVAENAKKPGYFPAIIVPKALEIGPKIQNTFAKAYKMGVPIAFGTDAGVYPHGENAREFVYMVEAGMPPMEAIISATSTNARVLRKEDQLGNIETGKLADIIAVPGNPLADINKMLEVSFVMKEGVVYKQE
ncbi:MAG: amidohydrolase family protein [Bacteroidota bacterium]